MVIMPHAVTISQSIPRRLWEQRVRGGGQGLDAVCTARRWGLVATPRSQAQGSRGPAQRRGRTFGSSLPLWGTLRSPRWDD